MIIKNDNFYESNTGEEIKKILSDDEVTNWVFVDDNNYIHLCQSKNGNRIWEVELCPSEMVKLKKFIDTLAPLWRQ